MTDLHRFMVAVARGLVDHDSKGGTAPDPLVSELVVIGTILCLICVGL